MNFFKKFGELQLLMLQHNAGLTASHPYASSPINWPFLLSGISFWTENESQKQIYLIGNVVGWWTCVIALSIYVGILGADLLARRRGLDPIPDGRWCLNLHEQFFTFGFSGPKPPVEFYRILHACLGCALRSLFPDESSTFHPPLPSFPSCVRHDRWFGPELHPVGDSKLPCVGMGPHYTRASEAVRGSWDQSADNFGRLLNSHDRLSSVLCAIDLWHARVRVLHFSGRKLLNCPSRLTGEQVNARRLLSTWTLHFAAKVTAEVL